MGDNEDNQCNVSDWKDIVSVSAGTNHTVGLKSDGTVVAVGGKEIGGTIYVVESVANDNTKETADSIVERLILNNLKLSVCSQ
mgnify:CR=1 FL=1